MTAFSTLPVSERPARGKAVAPEEIINHPPHYNSLPAVCSACGHPIECIDVVRHKDFDIGNAIKYLWRAGLKGDVIADLEKAVWYIQDEIKQIKKERGIHEG